MAFRSLQRTRSHCQIALRWAQSKNYQDRRYVIRIRHTRTSPTTRNLVSDIQRAIQRPTNCTAIIYCSSKLIPSTGMAIPYEAAISATSSNIGHHSGNLVFAASYKNLFNVQIVHTPCSTNFLKNHFQNLYSHPLGHSEPKRICCLSAMMTPPL